LMIPDVHVRPFVWTPQGNDELRVELHGLRYCSNAGSELALLARVARYFADREKVFDVGPLSAPAGLNITSAEVQNDLRLSDEQTQLVYRVITNFRIGHLEAVGLIHGHARSTSRRFVDTEILRRARTYSQRLQRRESQCSQYQSSPAKRVGTVCDLLFVSGGR